MRHLKMRRPVVVFMVLPLVFLLICSAALAAGTLTLDLPENAAPGEEIKISGSFQGDTTNGVAVGITVKDPSGSVVYVNETRTGNDGSFAFDFTLPGNAAGGKWQARVAGGGAVASENFSVNGSSVSVSSDSVQQGKAVTIEGKLKQGGVPVGLTVRDPSGAVRGVDEKNAAADGSYSFDFAVPADAATGTWKAEVAGGGEATSVTFVVTTTGGGRQDGGNPGGDSPGGNNGDSSPESGGGGTTGTRVTTPAAMPAAGEKEIDAATGGALSSADNMVSVTVPAGALTGNAILKIAEIAGTSNLPAGALRLGGKVYEVTLAGGSIKPGNPVKLIFAYDLPGVDEEQINAYYWNGSRWVCLGGRVVNGKLEVDVTHFTKFAVMADPGLPALTDVKAHWAYKEIKRLVGMNVVSGYPDNTFKPDNSVTRAEFAVILARAMGWGAGATVAAQGIVTTTPGIYGGKAFAIQDATGGLYVYTNTDYSLTVGDEVYVVGALKDYNGLLEFDPVSSVVKKSGGNSLPPVQTIVINQLGEDYESELVKLEGVKVDEIKKVNNYGAAKITVSRDNATVTVYVDNRCGVNYDDLVAEYKAGDIIDVTGIVSEYKGAYEVKPRSATDIVKNQAPAAINLTVPTGAAPGETVKISGVLTGNEVSGKPVGVTVKDPNGAVAYVDETVTGADGSFDFTFTIPANAAYGDWQVQVAAAGAAAEGKISVRGAAGVVTAAPDWVMPGDNITFSGKVSQRNVAVGITVKNPAGAVVLADETTAGADGSYQFTFNVPVDAPAGVWTVSAAGGGATGNATFKVDSYWRLTVMHTNDTHAHLDDSKAGAIIARRATAVKQVRAEAPNNLLLDAGDVFSGTLYFTQYQGQADLEFMNTLGYDAMGLGNHEFDKGPRGLAKFLIGGYAEGYKTPPAFPVVNSNFDFSAEPALSGLAKTIVGEETAGSLGEAIYPAVILDVNGEKVGLIGLTTEDTDEISSPGEQIKINDAIASASAAVDMLEGKGIDKIIAISHLGWDKDLALAQQVEGLDVVVGGHTHTKPAEYPTVVDARNTPTLVVQAGEYGNYLGCLDVSFEDGLAKEWNGHLLDVKAKDEQGNYVYAEDQAVKDRLAVYSAPLEEFKNTVVGSAQVVLDGEKNNVRTKETNLGNLIADAMLEKASGLTGANLAITNSGGIRASIDQGDITLGEILTVMPFGNTLTVLELTGRQVVDALENGVSQVESKAGRFPQVAGLKFTWNPAQPANSRVTQVEVKTANDYQPIDSDAKYLVATNNYMAGGGDGYVVFKQASRVYDTGIVDYEVFKEYLEKHSPVNPRVEGRITEGAGGGGGPVFTVGLAEKWGQLGLDPDLLEPEYVALMPDGSGALVSIQEGSAVAAINLTGQAPQLVDIITLPAGSEPDGVAITGDGLLAVMANEENQTVSLLDLSGGLGNISVAGAVYVLDLVKDEPNLKKTKKGKVDPEGMTTFSRNGKRYAVVTLEKSASLLVLDITDPQNVSKVALLPVGISGDAAEPGDRMAEPEGVAVSPEGNLIAVGNEEEGTVTLIPILDGQNGGVAFGQRTDFNPAGSECEIVAFTPDGKKLLVTNSAEKQVILLDISDTGNIRELRNMSVADGGEPTSVAVTPDGKYALVSVANGANPTVNPGEVLAMSLQPGVEGQVLHRYTVGQVPDSIVVTSTGKWAVVAIEAENDGDIAEDDGIIGSVAVIDLASLPPVNGNNGGGGGGSSSAGKLVTAGGGTITGQDATVVIPAGAVDRDVRVKIGKVTDTSGIPVPANAVLVSAVLNITRDKTGDFKKPVTIIMAFDKTKVDREKQEPGIYWFNDNSKQWTRLENNKVDFTAGKVSGDTLHFTKFAVLAIGEETQKPVEPPVETPAGGIKDIAGHWAEGAIKQMVTAGIVKGYPGGTFKPDNGITRAEFAVLLVKAFKLAPQGGEVFTDTAAHWAKNDIATAASHGIVSGYNDVAFGPDDPITREQMAAMIVRAVKIAATADVTSFTDSGDISAWARASVAAAVERGLMAGYSDNTFKPGNNATRAEAVTVISNALKEGFTIGTIAARASGGATATGKTVKRSG